MRRKDEKEEELICCQIPRNLSALFDNINFFLRCISHPLPLTCRNDARMLSLHTESISPFRREPSARIRFSNEKAESLRDMLPL